MEYLEYFQLTSEPFSNAPLSRFYFASRQHTEALNRLMYAASSMKGLAILIGDIGHGKTTLARRMLDALPESEYEAAMLVIVHAGITPNWLLKRIASQLGVPEPADDKLTILSQLYQRLLQIYQAGKRAVVIIDEAQMLASRELMEEFRGLLNLEVPDRKLITFVFFGLPEIVRNLQLDPPLAQRIALRYQLKPLTGEDTAAYIDHRLRIAGAKRQFFPGPVVQEIHRVTGGVPRLINTVCDNVLLEMFFAKHRLADLELVQQVAANFGLPQEPGAASFMPPPPPLEEELALDGAPGHDAIVAVARHPEELESPTAAAAPDDVPSAVTIDEAADIAARVAGEATPVPPEVDDDEAPEPDMFAAKQPPVAEKLEDIADPLAFLHEPVEARPASSVLPEPPVLPEPTADEPAPYYDDNPILLDNIVEQSPRQEPRPESSPTSWSSTQDLPTDIPPPPRYSNGEHETQVLTSELANLDSEVVEDGAALGFEAPSVDADSHAELDAMTPASEPLTQASETDADEFVRRLEPPARRDGPPLHQVPLARITPVSRPAPVAITEKPFRANVSPAALAGAGSVLNEADAMLNEPPPPPVVAPSKPATSGPLKTSTGRTIDLSEIDDLLADISNLTKK
jgi:type II secretory pathway predicted ATPase ExeA